MTREEAARVLTELADEYEKYELSANGWLGTTYIPAHRMGVAALRGPQPDPETGLVPCGCGGKAKVWPSDPTQFTHVITDYEVGCTECAMTTGWVRGKQENAVKAWNTAMGYQEASHDH